MQYKKINEGYGYVMVMEKGESIKEKLLEFAKAERIQSAYFSAIGSVDNAKIGYYNLPNKTYSFKEYPETYELASLQGNISLYDGKQSVHMHAVLRESDGTILAGHLDDAKVAITLEMFLHLLDGASINRKLDPEIGLPLWDFIDKKD